MKIISHGHLRDSNTPKEFKCVSCHCVFIAEAGEYEKCSEYPNSYYFCHCPECDAMTTTR